MNLLLNIDVPDLEAATTFYREAFGLTLGRRLGPQAVELLGWPAPVYLLENAEGARTAGEPRRYHRHWTPLHFDVAVEDLDAALARATAAGARAETAIRAEAYGRIVTLADPFGHGFCLIEFSADGYDAIATPAP